ncbi:glucose-1-phosphate thymidylylransferase, long form [Halorubrum coriense DSM 10284]|uniref:Glucose-1-phosphate thymidylylransferase, long form n=1 Tax=Halorubrum coriense DSM 10284 TaxID=1227466 RepID=M0EJ84_9EURY|nr:glucose-1-phosphate thymidylylransferase, long form [Halorubrum coriense DSM 10284]
MNKPVLEYVIEDLKQAGIDDIGVVLGGDFPEKVREQIGDGSEYDVSVTYIHQGDPRGLADAVRCAKEFVGDSPFVVYFGDTITGENITAELVREFDPNEHEVGIILKSVDDPTRFGIADLDGEGEIRRILEKPDDPPTNSAYIGVQAYTPAVFDIIEDLEPSDRGELELTHAIDTLISEYEAYWTETTGVWMDVGTVDDLRKANRHFVESMVPEIEGDVSDRAEITGRVRLAEGATVEAGTEIRGPVYIGEDTSIRSDARIGPYVTIGNQCTIRNADIRSTVIMDGVKTEVDCTLEESVIGPRSSLSGNRDQATCLNLTVGADSSITLSD